VGWGWGKATETGCTTGTTKKQMCGRVVLQAGRREWQKQGMQAKVGIAAGRGRAGQHGENSIPSCPKRPSRPESTSR
jgi:hypothetical protein